jgi:drug/metabolite transporter (DMT)-like permease
MGRSGLFGVLLAMGAGWGLTQPLSKIAVSGGHQPFGLVFWQLVICTFALGLVSLRKGGALPTEWRHIRLHVVIAVVGTILPNAASYRAAFHLPAGVMSILISMVPMFALPIALILGQDRFSWRRLGGLTLGLGGVALLVLPDTSLPDPAMVAFVPLALVGPLFYAFEANYVARFGTEGLDPMQTLFGASFVGAIIALPLALISGHWITPPLPLGSPEWALIGSSLIHAVVYSAYVWTVGRAGSVFAAQVSYLVTLCGVCWAMLILGEAYSPYIWAALAMILGGLALVQPRTAKPLQTDTA